MNPSFGRVNYTAYTMPSVEAALSPCRSSLLGGLAGVLATATDRRPLAEIAGLTGLAFAHRAVPGLGLDGPTAFPWASELGPALHGLGYDPRAVYAPLGDPLLAESREEAVRGLARELAAGRAALAWGIQLPAFGLVHGFDPDRRRLLVSGVLDGQGGRREMAVEELGGGDAPALFVLLLGERHEGDAGALPEWVLARAARELSGSAATDRGARSGLEAYGIWTEGLRGGRFDPAGAAYCLAILAEARSLAADFLASRQGGPALRVAADAMWRAGGALGSATRLLPFPLPAGTSINTALRASLAESLDRARQADAEALQALEQELSIERGRSAADVRVERLRPADAGDLFRCLVDLPVGGLGPSEDRCRQSVGQRLERDFFALVARGPDGAVQGHLYYAPLDRSFYPVRADRPTLLLFCAWVRKGLRGRGIGRRLVAELREHARTLGVAGILAEASELDVFLAEAAWRSLGFREIDREGPMRLCYLPADDRSPAVAAAWLEPTPGPAELVVRHAPNCPLLDASRRAAAESARAAGSKVDEADAAGPEAGVSAGGRRLPNLPTSGEAVHRLLE